jgi:tetratricopeptide (TPR) repeat protein
VNLPRLMVANPHSFSSQDSSAAVRIGSGMRERVDRIADRWYKVILREQMNEALLQYAYPADAVLPPLVARQLAQSLQARAMVASTVLRDAGRFTVEARLANMSDDAGHIVKVSQAPNQSLEEFGARVADSLSGAFHALPDAKQCETLRAASPEKAIEAAQKALKSQPNDGLAEYCLAQIAIGRKAPADSIIAHLKNSTRGDRLSLKTWTDLAVQYQAKGDSAATVETFKEMLRVAPTNERLRKEAFKLLQNYGKPEAAEEVADEGLAQDSANADLWDLKSNACLDQGQTKPARNKCAVDALERVFALDTLKADSLFFTKIAFAALQPLTSDSLPVIDTVRALKWTKIGVQKFPKNGTLIGFEAQAYGLAGPVDSTVSVTKHLMEVDSSDVTPVLRIAKALADTKRAKEALDLVPYVDRLGSPDDRGKMAAILGRGGFTLLQPPADYPVAADVGRAVIKLSQPNTPTWQLGNFVLGLATFAQIPPLDPQAEKGKSCPIAQQMKAFLDEAMPALQAGRSINEATAARFIQGGEQFTPRINSMIKAYCK